MQQSHEILSTNSTCHHPLRSTSARGPAGQTASISIPSVHPAGPVSDASKVNGEFQVFRRLSEIYLRAYYLKLLETPAIATSFAAVFPPPSPPLSLAIQFKEEGSPLWGGETSSKKLVRFDSPDTCSAHWEKNACRVSATLSNLRKFHELTQMTVGRWL